MVRLRPSHGSRISGEPARTRAITDNMDIAQVMKDEAGRPFIIVREYGAPEHNSTDEQQEQ